MMFAYPRVSLPALAAGRGGPDAVQEAMARSALLTPKLMPLALAAMLCTSQARADEQACDSCESCSQKLATPGAKVTIGTDLAHAGSDACIVIRGAGARLDALEHSVKLGAAGTAVRVEGADVLVSNLHVRGGTTAVEVASAERTTLFHLWIADTSTGVRVVSSDEVRITRSVIGATSVGISFGASADGACGERTELTSPGAVVTDTRVEGAKVGIASCEAYPVLARNVVVNNGVGVVLGAPATRSGSAPKDKGAFDPCACAATLEGVSAGTTLLYSSGCGGCQVHEGWLPDLRKQKHDIVVREVGPGKAEAGAKFDAFIDRCAPEVTDAIGIPGCVPNYTCLANGVTFKIRRGDTSLTNETQLASSDDVAAYASACKAAASKAYRGGADCVAHALVGNVMCKNREQDVRAMAGGVKLDGIDDTCDRAEGYSDKGATGCAKPCGPTMPALAEPPPRASRETPGAAPLASGAPTVPSAAPSASVSGAQGKDASESPKKDRWTGWLVGIGGVALAAAALRMMLRSSK